jgi:hypothetical protein
VSLLDTLRSVFSLFGGGNRSEAAVAQYVIREHHRGRDLTEILDDPYVTNRCTPAQMSRLLDRPELSHAIGEDMIDRTRSERAGS